MSGAPHTHDTRTHHDAHAARALAETRREPSATPPLPLGTSPVLLPADQPSSTDQEAPLVTSIPTGYATTATGTAGRYTCRSACLPAVVRTLDIRATVAHATTQRRL